MKSTLMLVLLAISVFTNGCAFKGRMGDYYPRNSVAIWNESSNSQLQFFKNGEPWPTSDVEYRKFRYSRGVAASPTIVLKNCSRLDSERITIAVMGSEIIHDGFTTREGPTISMKWRVKSGIHAPAKIIIVRRKDFEK